MGPNTDAATFENDDYENDEPEQDDDVNEHDDTGEDEYRAIYAEDSEPLYY